MMDREASESIVNRLFKNGVIQFRHANVQAALDMETLQMQLRHTFFYIHSHTSTSIQLPSHTICFIIAITSYSHPPQDVALTHSPPITGHWDLRRLALRVCRKVFDYSCSLCELCSSICPPFPWPGLAAGGVAWVSGGLGG